MKTFIWIIGKPGSGKSTVGNFLTTLTDTVHFSYGQLLKQVRPKVPVSGYSTRDRMKVNEIILEAGKKYSTVVVDGNPYSKLGFGFLEQIEHSFDQIHVVHFCINDDEALLRLKKRNREVLAHDGTSQKERIEIFNKKLRPLIDEYKENHPIAEIEVVGMAPHQIMRKVIQIIGKS